MLLVLNMLGFWIYLSLKIKISVSWSIRKFRFLKYKEFYPGFRFQRIGAFLRKYKNFFQSWFLWAQAGKCRGHFWENIRKTFFWENVRNFFRVVSQKFFSGKSFGGWSWKMHQLPIFSKHSLVDVWKCSDYVSGF